MVTRVEDPLEMIGHFRSGTVYPCRFRWQGRVHRVISVSSRWESRRGSYPCHHYMVRTHHDDVFEIHLDCEDMRWYLDYLYD